MKKLLVILLVVFTLTGCGTKEKPKEKQPEEKLSVINQFIFDKMLEFISETDVDNPSEMKLLNAVISYEDDKAAKSTDNIFNIYVKIQGTNKAGGTITECIELYSKSREETIELWDSFSATRFKSEEASFCKKRNGYEEIDVSAINKELTKHWKDLGL